MFRINVFRYQYKVLRGTNPCEFLESPTNFNDPSPDKPDRIIVREHGGDSDNHVQWVSTSDIEPYKIFRGTSEAHGKIIKSNGFNNREDKVWLRSDQPLTRGRKSAPIVNLTQLQNAEVWIADVNWRSDKRQRNRGPGLLTIAGPEYPFFHSDDGRFRMCIVQNRDGPLDAESTKDVLNIISIEEMEANYEDTVRR